MADATHLYSGFIREASHRYGVPVGVIERVIKAESAGNPTARSPMGAVGLMQLMPQTARGLGVENPLDPRENIMGGTKYLREQMNHFGSLRKALAAYNAGPAAVTKYGGVPPFHETQAYVNEILGGIPNVGAAPQESPPALAASAGMGGRAPTPRPQGPNMLQMAQHLAEASQQQIGGLGTDQPQQPPQPQPMGLGSGVSEGNNLEKMTDPNEWRQFLPHAQPNANEMAPLRGVAPRLMPPAHGDNSGVVQAARGYLGTPYKWGGTSRQSGLDCSAFVQSAFKDIGISLPRTTYEQVKVGHAVGLHELQPGDVIFTEPGHAGPNHEGLYIGHGMVQESPHTGTVNSIIPLKDYLGGGFVAARRYTHVQKQPKQGKQGKR